MRRFPNILSCLFWVIPWIAIDNPFIDKINKEPVLKIQKTTDFSINGKGTAREWAKTGWITIPQRATTDRMAKNPAPVPDRPLPPAQLDTQAKILYSNTGIYFLFQCEDRVLQAAMQENFKQVWWEDVVEIFIWPDEKEKFGTFLFQ